MNIIQLIPSETGSRSPIQSWDVVVPPDGYAAVSPDCDTSAMQTHCGHVDLTIEGGMVTAITGNDAAYQEYIASAPDEKAEPTTPTTEDRLSALESAMLSMMGVNPSV